LDGADDVAKAKLPFAVYAEAGDTFWIPSGNMGNTNAIKMFDDGTDNPKSGKTCLKAEHTAPDNGGGVVWQSPANNWDGEKPVAAI